LTLPDASARARIHSLLFLLPATQVGGAERHALELCAAFRRRGVAVTVACIERSPIIPRLRAMRLDWIAADIAWDDDSKPPENIARHQAAVEKLLERRFDFAVISLSWPNYGYGLHRALAARDLPHILISHLAPIAITPFDFMDADFRETFQRGPFAWVGVSEPIARRIEHLFGLEPFSARHIPNGVAAPAISARQRDWRKKAAREKLGVDPARKLVLALGRLDTAKGSDLLPEIGDSLAELDALIVCAGAGALATVIKDSPAHAAGRLRLMGQIDDVSVWLDAADVLLLPSRIEGDPLVFLEAASARCPVVATDAALEAYGTQAKSIALIAETDDVAQLSQHLKLALTTPNALTNQLQNALNTARLCEVSHMIDLYMSLCRMTFAQHRFGRSNGVLQDGRS